MCGSRVGTERLGEPLDTLGPNDMELDLETELVQHFPEHSVIIPDSACTVCESDRAAQQQVQTPVSLGDA